MLDALIVGAGPTGLTLAAGLARFGVRFRVIDRAPDRGRESRALAVQARTLEVFQCLGLGEALVRRGNPGARVVVHLDIGRGAEVRLGGVGRPDTRFPFVLFVSQTETEAVLGEHLGGGRGDRARGRAARPRAGAGLRALSPSPSFREGGSGPRAL